MANSSFTSRKRPPTIILNARVLVSLVLLVCVIFVITSNRFWRWMYPIEYQSVIQSAGRTADVDPLLVASIIRVESKFKTDNISHAGAAGLMQLMPTTAQWIASQMQREGKWTNGSQSITTQRLGHPEVNIQLGSWYVRYLIRRFNGNTVAAVAAYNAGPKRVQGWLQGEVWNGQLGTITDIPVGETRHFVDRVFYNYQLYRRIYGSDASWKKYGS